MITIRILLGPTEYLVKTEWEVSCANLFKWIRENHMKFNPSKCDLVVTLRKAVRINTEGHIIYNCTEEKLFGVKIDSELLFESHVSTLCKKVIPKL